MEKEETKEVICGNCGYTVMANGIKIIDYWKSGKDILCEPCFDKIVRKRKSK